jgi:hypothetical protein
MKKSKHKIVVGTHHNAELHIEAEISAPNGCLNIEGIPCVTYEMYNSVLSLMAFDMTQEGPMTSWNIYLDDKPLEEGMEYFVFDKDKMELVETVLDPESEWTGLMYWTVQDALDHLKLWHEGELLKVCELKFDGPPHYLLKI